MSKFLFLVFLSLSFGAKAQEVFEFERNLNLLRDGKPVSMPFSGGINSAQIQLIDLTNDGVEEWVTWDINSRQLQVFEKKGDKFTHRPELSYFFPSDISGFLVLADYDGDGKKDLFTSTPLGIRAYRNTSSSNQISWTLAQNFLRLEGANNIPANNLDTPLLQDLDGDGDLDLVIFNFASGDYLEFYRNTSAERKGTPDIDGFAFPIRHWGGFEFCGCNSITFGTTCDGRKLDAGSRVDENARIQHAGGHSILYRDFTGDGISDLLIGRDECNTLYFLPNSGSSAQPKFTSFSTQVPGFGSLPEFPRFHVGQLFEQDLVISLNTNEVAAPFGIDFGNSVVKLEKNTGTVTPILQDQLFDLGENVRPYFKGNKFAGELWLTANTKQGGNIRGMAYRLSYSDKEFELLNVDYLGLSSLNLLDLQLIEYGSTQKKSYLLSAGVRTTNGIPSQVLLQNQDGNWTDFSLSGLSLRVGDQLTFFPYLGKDHLLVAAQNGSLSLYEVTFSTRTASLKFSNFLGFQDNPANRNLSVAVRIQERPNLYTVDQTGRIFLVNDFMNQEQKQEVLVKIGAQNQPFRQGRNTWISIVNPGFDEEVDLILGSRGGGITYLRSAKTEEGNKTDFQVKVYPNPSEGPVKLISNLPSTAHLVNSAGKYIRKDMQIPANREIELPTENLASGLYILQFRSETKQSLSRKIWIH
jgi:hypothetical protein